jgi:hypothetical protein
MRNEHVVKKRGNIVEHALGIQPQFAEQTQILCVELLFLAVDFVEGVGGGCVDERAGGWGGGVWTCFLVAR